MIDCWPAFALGFLLGINAGFIIIGYILRKEL